MPDMNITSPAAGFARQARAEKRVADALEWALDLFLADIRSLAYADRTYLGRGQVDAAWQNRMGAHALATRLPLAEAEYIAVQQMFADTPAEAYDTAMSVMTAATVEGWDDTLTRDVLAYTLGMEPEEALTAAAPKLTSKRGRAMEAAFDQALGGTRKTWLAVARRDARTAMTGMDGSAAIAEMRRLGVRTKRWVAHHDDRTRRTHMAADGQSVPLDQPFLVGDSQMMHPGDRNGTAAEIVNCRCITVAADYDVDLAPDEYDPEALARQVAADAKAVEPSITKDMKALAAQTGQRLEGLAFRLKDQASLARKIATDAAVDKITTIDAARSIGDAVRYTMIATPGKYAASVKTTIAALRSQGWSARVKNAWADPRRAYQGVNVALISPSGMRVELQFHTQQSFDAKMSKAMHGTYEKQRVLSRSDPRWQEYEDYMHEYMRTNVRVPRGVTTIA